MNEASFIHDVTCLALRREFQAGSTGTQENRIVAYVELLRRPNEPLGLVLEGMYVTMAIFSLDISFSNY